MARGVSTTMARMNADKKFANAAACIVSLSMVIQDLLTGKEQDKTKLMNRLKAVDEIAFQLVDLKQEMEFGESLIAIAGYNPPPEESENGQTAEVEKPPEAGPLVEMEAGG